MPYIVNDFKIIDSHVHFFPSKLFKAIWEFFEVPDKNGTPQGWPVKYKMETEELVQFLKKKNIKNYTTFNYAHKAGVAEFINEWTYKFIKKHKNAIPFGCVSPEDQNRGDYTRKLFDEYEFKGLKLQLLVQNFYPDDERMSPIYNLVIERGKFINFHVGTAPYRNKYVGYSNFIKFLKKFPNIHVIVSHMGGFEYKKFIKLVDQYENLYLDTAMIFIPENIFPERKSKLPDKEDIISYSDKILFGSDFPNIPYDYENSVKGLLNLELPKSVYVKIFYENAKRLFLK
ncbi:MAG: amidohydrolase [Promethearchaeota archaeon]|nr:MAG: amidohydrolase [Candidatus Lokiarchaeota archaeon]